MRYLTIVQQRLEHSLMAYRHLASQRLDPLFLPGWVALLDHHVGSFLNHSSST